MIARIIATLLAPVACYLAFGFVAADFNAWSWGIDGRAFFIIVATVITMMVLTIPPWRD